jgi:hypothetical protein
MIDCYICDGPIDFDEVWFQLLVQEPGNTEYGHLCSLACLTDYVAKVHAIEIAEHTEDSE